LIVWRCLSGLRTPFATMAIVINPEALLGSCFSGSDWVAAS